MNGEVKLDKSRQGHMIMLIINGILIDPSGSDKYGKNGIGTTNIQEKGHVIGWPDGVVLYDKKYSTIK